MEPYGKPVLDPQSEIKNVSSVQLKKAVTFVSENLPGYLLYLTLRKKFNYLFPTTKCRIV